MPNPRKPPGNKALLEQFECTRAQQHKPASSTSVLRCTKLTSSSSRFRLINVELVQIEQDYRHSRTMRSLRADSPPKENSSTGVGSLLDIHTIA